MRKEVGLNECKIKQNILQLLFDENLEIKINTKLEFLKNIADFKCKLTEPECTIADAVELCFELYENQENILYKQCMETTFKKCSKKASNFLHPAYKGRKFLSQNHFVEKKNTSFFLENLAAKGMNQLSEYMTEK